MEGQGGQPLAFWGQGPHQQDSQDHEHHREAVSRQDPHVELH